MKPVPGKNQSRGEVKRVMTLLLQSANRKVRMTTGLTTGLFNEIQDVVVDCAARVQQFDMYIERSRFDTAKQTSPWLFGIKTIRFFQVPDGVAHWMAIDDRDYRLEEHHSHDIGPNDPRSNTLLLECTASEAELLNRMFDAIVEGSEFVQGPSPSIPG